MVDTPASLSINRQCKILCINRSSYYCKSLPESALNLELMWALFKVSLLWIPKDILSRTSNRSYYLTQAKQGIENYFDFYNTMRPHETFGTNTRLYLYSRTKR